MRMEVTGKQLDVGDVLRSHAERKLDEAIQKFSFRPTEASITFSRDGHLFVCDCVTHLSTGLTARASARDTDVYAACDLACVRLEKQLRRHKRRLRDHHHKRKEPVAQQEAAAYVLRSESDHDADDVVDSDATGQVEFWNPPVIAEETVSIASLTVGEAVMQMELSDAQFLLFFNDARSRINAIYRREDGNIGWIDPALGKSSQQ